jgi:hypothetical protein
MILIFSPQNWSHQFISKHHYAIAFSKNEKTFFIEPTTCEIGHYHIKSFKPFPENDNLVVIKITLPFPDIIRFKASSFFKAMNKYALLRWIKGNNLNLNILIDFGCHKSIANWVFIDCKKKVYFPVDDFEDLPIENRGCNSFFTVSTNIQEKFYSGGIPMHFMHHGLNDWFADRAIKRLIEIENGGFINLNNTIRIAYSGNLTIPFLDREFLLQLISSHVNIQFHFFGKFESNDINYLEWFEKLKSYPNVYFYGQLSIENLAKQLFKMDAMLLCYKADNKNFHAENSHKINEYLSTGAPLLTTRITVIENEKFIYPIDVENQEMTNSSFEKVIFEASNFNEKKFKERINYALKYQYDLLIKKIL